MSEDSDWVQQSPDHSKRTGAPALGLAASPSSAKNTRGRKSSALESSERNKIEGERQGKTRGQRTQRTDLTPGSRAESPPGPPDSSIKNLSCGAACVTVKVLSLSRLYRIATTFAVALHSAPLSYLPLSIGSSVPLFSIRCVCVFVAFRRHCGALCMASTILLFSLPAYSRWIIIKAQILPA